MNGDSKDIVISLVSGLLGVIIGAAIQIAYSNKSEKRHLIHEYKQMCLQEWIALREDLKNLLDNPHVYNHVLFRISVHQKTLLLSFLKTKKNQTKIIKLQKTISDEDKRLSLGDFSEEALNIGKNEENKKKLVRSILTLSTEVIKVISTI